MTPSFATWTDLEDGWRPLTDDEQRRADTLLRRASLKVRRRFPSVDARIAAGTLDAEEVITVVVGMVQRAMGSAGDGVTQQSDTAGVFSTSLTFANPQGNLYFTAEDVMALSRRRTTSLKLNLPTGF